MTASSDDAQEQIRGRRKSAALFNHLVSGCKKTRTNLRSRPGRVPSGSYRGALECGLGLPKGNGTSQRSRTRPNRMAVVAALHDPLTVLVADDFADVVTPDNDSPD